jgi:hypothetical protein
MLVTDCDHLNGAESLLEKLAVAQIIKTFSAFFGIRRFTAVLERARKSTLP